MSDLLEQLEIHLANGILERVMPEINRRLYEQVTQVDICFSEKEAAAKLHICSEALAKMRKNKEIDYSYAIVPTFGKDKKPTGGRVVYLASHLYDYLLRRQVTHGTPKVTLHDVLGGLK